ncbi:MAG: helix-turn-helix domain-containing protein, partial [Acidobacteriota bacterium]|nr:helix-turn-helix domain-containing protein [Acidobacteriota bacterium]
HGRGTSGIAVPRALTDDELLRVRKILACASRMKGRFGKNILAGTLRGSASKNVMQAHLNELSTYGLLKDMPKDDILLYIDALCTARCLRVSPGEYPTVSITGLGERVMREQERVELALAEDGQSKDEEEPLLPSTALQTYTLFRNGQSVEEIAAQRKLVVNTVEGHLIECISAGLAVDISILVSTSNRALIEKAINDHGADKLKPIRESLPENISYNMIRFVVAQHRLAKAAK